MLRWIQQFRQKKTAFFRIVVLSAVFFFLENFFFPAFVLAQDTLGIQAAGAGTVLSGESIILIVVRVINAALALLGIVTVGLVLYAGYLIMTAGGNEEKVAQGKLVLRNAVIGLAIILSSFAIVQFVLSRLGAATGVEGLIGRRGPRTSIGDFSGSGALGEAIADHYPFRDERGVRRNTRIVVTFGEPVNPASFIADTNGNGVVGDCLDTGGEPLDWAVHCDQANTEIIRIAPTIDPGAVVPLAALAVPSGEANEIFTVVFRPLALLGSDIAPVAYSVELAEDILRAADETSVFSADLDGRYAWEFETATTIDTEPPSVENVYPSPGSRVPRNSVLQINFTEAVDPSVVQGTVGGAGGFTHIVFGNAAVAGEWQVSNAYRTVEFVSNDPCGENSCGEEMYCLPADPGATVLLRTSRLLSTNSFESIPLTGVADMAGNALDGDSDGVPDGQPALPADRRTAGAGESQPDNYQWSFAVDNTIDRAAPYVRTVSPGIDAEEIPFDAPVSITFSHRMWGATFRHIGLMNHESGDDEVPFWHRTRAETSLDDSLTVAEIDHRDFLDTSFYFPTVSSTVKNLTQNCLYPGRGPATTEANTSPSCVYEEDAEGNPLPGTGVNCVPVNSDRETDTGCVYTTTPNPDDWRLPTMDACLERLGEVSPLF